MKAFLLAGGLGERLRPLTDRIPKCLVPIGDQPLLGVWLDLIERHGIHDVLINVSQHIDQVRDFVAMRANNVRITLVGEARPVGNAGTVAANSAFVDGESDFWVIYSDNLTDVDLTRMANFHRQHDGAMTMGLFRAPVPEAAGIVEMDERGCIHGFIEKPERPLSNLANAGIYLARPDVLEVIPRGPAIVDFGRDVFPKLVGRVYGYVIDEFLTDIGTPAALDRAAREWPRVSMRMDPS